jgi:DNA-binding IscR family transcriptional regulator
LRDIYAAIGHPPLIALGNRTEAPGCPVEQAVNAALSQAFRDAEKLLLARLGEVTLANASADFHRRLKRRGGPHQLEDGAWRSETLPSFPAALRGLDHE